MSCKILHTEYYLPEASVSNEELLQEFPQLEPNRVYEKLGVKSRHVARTNETAVDMAQKAAEKVFEKFDKREIDFVILCTQSPDYMLPTSACILQDVLGLRSDIGAFDFNLGCSGYIYGLAIAKGLIKANIATNVLLLTSETYSKYIYHKDRASRTIFGDGASASIITKAVKEQIFEFVLGTDGSGKDKIIVPNGGMRNPKSDISNEIIDKSGNVSSPNHFLMNGPDVFNFTIKRIPDTVTKCLNTNTITLEDIDYFIFHQANKYMLEYLRKKTKIPTEKFYIDMETVGNTVSSTIPIALQNSIEKGLVKEGNKVLLVGFGVGLSWAATLIEI